MRGRTLASLAPLASFAFHSLPKGAAGMTENEIGRVVHYRTLLDA